jgi:DNA polymerase I-like protein with 3'-5' exonuclease and polymerase domains
MKIGTLVVPMSLEARELYNDKTGYYRRNPKSISQKVWSKAIGKRRRATPEEAAYMDCGNLIRTSFERGIDGLEELLSRLATACKKGYIRIQDGRHIPVRSPHAALNCLLQSWAAVILKRWVCISDELQKRDEVDYHLMAIIHDEIQADVHNEHVQAYTTNCLEAIKMTEKYYNIRCPLAGEAKVGFSWGDCH